MRMLIGMSVYRRYVTRYYQYVTRYYQCVTRFFKNFRAQHERRGGHEPPMTPPPPKSAPDARRSTLSRLAIWEIWNVPQQCSR